MRYVSITLLMILVITAASQAAMLNDVNDNPTIHASGLWHFDGDMNDQLCSGSTSTPVGSYSWVTSGPNMLLGDGAIDLTGGGAGTQMIDLVGNAQIDDSNAFGIAMWVKRVDAYNQYACIFGFNDSQVNFRLKEHGWYSDGDKYLPDRSDLGTAPLGGGSGTFIHATKDKWSFISVFAYHDDNDGNNFLGIYSADVNGVQTGYTTVAFDANKTLNGSDEFWIGGSDEATRSTNLYMDELVISNQACDKAWAEAICAVTTDGNNLVRGDSNDLLRITMTGSDWTLTKDANEQRTFTIKEDPLLGSKINENLIDSNDTVLYALFNDMVDHNSNSIVIGLDGAYYGDANTTHFIDLAHARGLQVYGALRLPDFASLLDTDPNIAMLDQNGVSMEIPCVLSDEYKAAFIALYDINNIIASGIDGHMIDEPAVPAWKTSYYTGRLGCYCSDCNDRYYVEHGNSMPDIDFPDDYGSSDWDKIQAFRHDSYIDWITFVCDHLDGVSDNFNVSLVYNPEVYNPVSFQMGNYMKLHEAAGVVDVNDTLDINTLDSISCDPYWNAWNRDPNWYQYYEPKYIADANDAGKGSIFWVQAFLETAGQIEIGLHPNEVTTAIDNSLGLGADGVFIWYYNGFSQESDYDWPEYFDEFSDAVAPYLNRDAEHVTIQPTPSNTPNFSYTQSSPGSYTVSMSPNSVGDFELKFINAAGIFESLKFTVE